MKTEPVSFLLLLALLLVGAQPAVSQPGSGRLPSVIAQAVDTVPFSFVYDGKPSSDLLPQWEKNRRCNLCPAVASAG
jgi:hypothetical protein